MAGTKNSGNPWQIHVNPDAAFGVFIYQLAGKDKQGVGTWVINLILKVYSKEVEEFFKDRPELLEEYRIKYSKTIVEQAIEKSEKEKEAKEKEERLLALEEQKQKNWHDQTFAKSETREKILSRNPIYEKLPEPLREFIKINSEEKVLLSEDGRIVVDLDLANYVKENFPLLEEIRRGSSKATFVMRE